MTDTTRAAVSIATAANMYDTSRDTIRAAIDKRLLPAKRLGAHIRIDVADLREWFANLDDAKPES